MLGGDSSTENWLGRYRLGERVPVQVNREAELAVEELSAQVGQPRDWLLARLLFAHAHGQLRVEQVWPRPHAAGDLASTGISVALAADAQALALDAGLESDTYLSRALLTEVDGIYSADAVAEVGTPPWAEDSEAMKVWLPETLSAAVRSLADTWEISASDVLRNLLLVHLYGRLGYHRAVANGSWVTCRRLPEMEPAPLFSRRQADADSVAPRTQFIRDYGKSGEAFKFWCPQPMKDSYADLAKARHLTLSEYVRRALVAMVLGRCASSAAGPGL